MKRAWHFSTKLNSMDIQKCNCFWVNLKTFGFIFTFLITKNSLGTLKPIAAQLQKKDQDVFQAYSMIDDTIKGAAECHEDFPVLKSLL